MCVYVYISYSGRFNSSRIAKMKSIPFSVGNSSCNADRILCVSQNFKPALTQPYLCQRRFKLSLSKCISLFLCIYIYIYIIIIIKYIHFNKLTDFHRHGNRANCRAIAKVFWSRSIPGLFPIHKPSFQPAIIEHSGIYIF